MKKIILLLTLLFANVCYSSEIYDNANLFSETAKTQARQTLEQVQQKSGVETIIETVNVQVPKFNSNHEKDKFWEQEIVSKASERGATGVFVLISKKPGRVQVDFHRQVPGNQQDKVKIRDSAVNHFKNQDFNGGLTAITKQISNLLVVTPTEEAPRPDPEPTPVVRAKHSKPIAAKVEAVQPVKKESHVLFYFAFFVAAVVVVIVIAVRNDIKKNEEQYNSTVEKLNRASDYVSSRPVAPSGSYGYKSTAPAPTVVHNGSSTGDTLRDMAIGGLIGHAIGSHNSHSSPAPMAVPVAPPAPSYTPDPTPSRSYSNDDDSSDRGYSGGSGSDYSSSSSDDSYSGGSGSDYSSGSDWGGGGGSDFSSGGDFGGGSGGDF